MIELKDVEKLAQLARIDLNDEEKTGLQKDLESILGYVSELKDAPVPAEEGILETALVRNIFRDDEEANEPGKFTDDILADAPDTDGKYFKVKKILG